MKEVKEILIELEERKEMIKQDLLFEEKTFNMKNHVFLEGYLKAVETLQNWIIEKPFKTIDQCERKK